MTRPAIILCWLLTGGALVQGQTPSYPEIENLSPLKDPLFKQQQDLVDLSYQALASGDSPGDLVLFQYRTKEEDTLFSLASRFNLPYETLATLNGLRVASAVKTGMLLLVPTQPGIFIAVDHPGELDRLIDARVSAMTVNQQRLVVQRGSGPETLMFFQGVRFHPLERAFFLGILFRFPLPSARLTSPFGIRSNPFTGHPTFHAGIDLAAPTGTDVYAARDGTVVEIGVMDRVLGNYVKVDHGDGYQTVYGHMSFVLVSLHQQVRSGTIIGRVGSTGMSTGPHLHFEIRRQGQAEDPVPLLPGKL